MGRVVILFMTQTPSFSGICCWIIPLLFFIAFYPHLNQLLLHELDIAIDILSIDNKTERLKFRILLNNLNGQWPFLRKKNLISELPEPLFQSEVLHEAIDMKILFLSSSKWNHYHKKVLHLPWFWNWGFLLWAPWSFKEDWVDIVSNCTMGLFWHYSFYEETGSKFVPKTIP